MRRCNSATGNTSFERIAVNNQCGDDEMVPEDSARRRNPAGKSGESTRRKGRRPSFFLRANSGKIKEDHKEEPEAPPKNTKKGKRAKEEDKSRGRNKNSRLLNLKRNSSAEGAPESHRISRMFGRLEAGPPQLSSSFRFRNQNAKDVPVKKSSESDVSGDRPVTGLRTGEKRPDTLRESEEKSHNDDDAGGDDVRGDIHSATKAKNSATSINRSESYRERIPQKKIREKRKTSDPNLSKTSDVDLDTQGLSYTTNSGSSSNSSLSARSLDSPSTPLDMVTATQQRVQEAVTVTLTPNHTLPVLGDSDTEAEPDPPDWTKGVDENVLKSLSSREKKRQEVINELFHTEKTHVTKLKVLDQIFLKPMQESQILPADQLHLLFQNLEEMLDIHSRFNSAMKARKKESPLVGEVGDIILAMFDGAEGDNFQRAAAVFCAKQQIALEQLKERRKKDTKLNNFLTEAEGHSMCRRLQLKDMLPTVMQRLTKYPLLFKNLATYSQGYTEEEKSLHKAVELSKAILNHVNLAVKAAGDHQRLEEIQKRLDKSGFEKVDHPITNEFKNLDLRTHKLIYEGSLGWRIGNRQKPIEIYVLLLHDIIILLQKQDEKFVLKFYNMNTSSLLSPIVKVSSVLVRHNAVDKSALYLVNTSQNNAQIYDLVASSQSERIKWFRHITEAADAYKNKDHFGKNRRLDLNVSSPQSPPDSENADDSSEKQKELDDNNENDTVKGNNELETSGASQDGSESNQSNDSSQNSVTTATPQTSPSLSGRTETGDQGKKSVESSPSHRTTIEPLRLSTVENSLIQPSEVVVSQKPVLTAERVLTPLEQLRLKDEAVRRALMEKQQLMEEILHVPKGEFETIADMAAEPSMDKEETELILAAVNQANHLVAALNDSLNVTEEEVVAFASEVQCSPRSARRKSRLPEVPTHKLHKLQGISVCLNSQLTQLLKIMKERDEERERLRRELQRCREMIHFLHEVHRKSPKSDARVPEDVIQESSDVTPDPVTQVDTAAEESTPNDLSQQHADSRDGNSDVINEVFVDALTGEPFESTAAKDEPETEEERKREASEVP
ncbi:UNVERIFIED_CONTAM: hypothetical protein PYX00_006146 [Menopon gallinae]|uniref:Rho guanine nucleotide exchange factor 12 n=1 Tax=Menopon gallinae TaxID=328185 RepID=A0AAW2HV53_9NEOP